MPVNNPFEFFLQLHLTERCNLRCKHCYQDGGRTDELTLQEISQLIDEVSYMLQDWKDRYNISLTTSFNVTGGEPFLRHDFFSVIGELKNRGFETYILSNGTLISREKAQALARLGVDGVQISIEGPEDIHDSIRGKGSFSLSMKGIENLLEAGTELTLNTTLSEMNAPYFMDIIELASSTGVQRLGFSRLVPSGGGRQLLRKMLKREDAEALYKKIFSLDTGALKIVTGDPVASQLRGASGNKTDSSTPSGGCAAGLSGLTVLPDGTVTPCRRLPVTIGNVREDSLREIWATSEVLNALRDKSRYQGRCGRCASWSVCRGCRAIAFAFSEANGQGNCLAEDPQCFIND